MLRKRIFALMLVVVLVFSAFAGCAKAKDKDVNSQGVTENDTTQSQGQDEGQSDGAQETKPVEPETSAPTIGSLEAGTYTVNDPDNTRGLSTTAYGFSFGVAKNEKPHQITVDNQKRFDSLPNVRALAWDSKTEEKVLYLTFDCGYEYNDNTTKVLDVLKEKKIKAAFFCTLPYIKDNEAKVERMILEGHIVGNHSTTHPVFTNISRAKMAEELFGVYSALRTKFGYTTKYFRFPTGKNSDDSLELVTSQGYSSIFWSIAYKDYDTANQPGEDVAFKTITDRLHPGAVILLHIVSDDNAKILAKFIDYAQSNGYTFKTLDDYYANN